MNSEETNTESKLSLSSYGLAKQGYKETVLGWIPEHWSIQRLSKMGSFKKGKGIQKSDIKEEGIPCILYGEIYTSHDFLIREFESFINAETAKNSEKLQFGDILFAGSGEKAEEIGKSVAYVGYEDAYAGGDIIIFSPKKNDSKFLGYLLNSEIVNKQKYSMAQGYSVVHLYSSHLKKVRVPIPPLPEQKKIANILSTWDEAIDKIEKLITKKKELKKGLMQQLLTVAKGRSAPKTRFLGFEKKWKRMRLNKVFDFLRSISVSRKDLEVINHQDGTLNVHYGDIHTKFNSVSCLDVGRSKNIPSIVDDYSYPSSIDYAKDGDVIMVDASEDYEGVGECIELENVGEKKLTAGLHTFLLRDKKDLTVPGFRSLVFEQHEVKRQLKRLVTGSKVFGLSKTNLSKVKVFIPPKEEQRRIVQVLQNIESEIERLKSLERYLGIQKNGLMQQLLTGRTRVQT